jgi:hypothetical protein
MPVGGLPAAVFVPIVATVLVAGYGWLIRQIHNNEQRLKDLIRNNEKRLNDALRENQQHVDRTFAISEKTRQERYQRMMGVLDKHDTVLDDVRERVAHVEAKVNGRGHK